MFIMLLNGKRLRHPQSLQWQSNVVGMIIRVRRLIKLSLKIEHWFPQEFQIYVDLRLGLRVSNSGNEQRDSEDNFMVTPRLEIRLKLCNSVCRLTESFSFSLYRYVRLFLRFSFPFFLDTLISRFPLTKVETPTSSPSVSSIENETQNFSSCSYYVHFSVL